MSQSDEELDRLEEILASLPPDNFPMSLSELDGYVTGLLCCPELIPPSEWLSQVWSETGEAEFPDLPTAETTISAVMAHYNAVALQITTTLGIEPIYELDLNSDETLWEPWVDGFTRAMRVRPKAWERLLETADAETQSSLIFLMALQDIYEGTSTFTEDDIDEIDLQAPDLIVGCVATILLAARPELFMAADNLDHAPIRARRPGRNDPYPCGSGRKYKHCCGRN
jgi:uncharacterized protein